MHRTAWSRRAVIRVAGALTVLVLAGCTGSPAGGASTGTGPVPPSTSAPSSGTADADATEPVGEPGPEPVLGATSSRPQARGLGDARPALIDLGGASSTGIIEDLTWQDWGGSTATGTGTAAYVAPGAPLASATRERATVVAADPGTCDDRLAYRSLSFYFPQHGETAGARSPLGICDP